MSNMNFAIECALKENGISKFNELKSLMTDSQKIQQRTVKGGRIFSSNGSSYLLEAIYHSYLDEDQKVDIYSSEYEIGNPNLIEDLNKQSLYQYLEEQYGGSAEDSVKRIEQYIKKLTGVTFQSFLSNDIKRVLAYKIITLFYKLSKYEFKGQSKIQLFNFLDIETRFKMQFEFRASHSYRDAEGRGYENTALLAELLGYLTFSMPKEYLEQARLMETYLPTIADQISMHTRNYIEPMNNAVGHYDDSGQMANLNKIADGNLKSAFNSIFESVGNQSTQRLDFLLYNLISLKGYIARKSSNELLAKLVHETPLELQPFQGRKCKTWEDKHFIPYLLGYDKSVSKSVDKQADFIEKYILARKMNGTTALPAQNKQILKAVIIHDSAIDDIKIDSFVFGGKNIPSSITAVLKTGVRDLENSKVNGTSFSYESYPEAILLYWGMRYQLALRIVLSKDKQKAINQYRRIANWETRIDEVLIEYVKNANLNTYDELLTLPKKLQVLLSNTIEPLS